MNQIPACRPVHTENPPSSCSIDVGRVLRGRYVLEERLGSGGKGTVFKALDRYRADLPEARQYVALKIFHATADNRETDDLDARRARLRHEFYSAQMLSHRNIVNLFDLDRDGDVDFFTMEFLEGDLLSDVMARLHPLAMSRPQAWAIIREIGSGLEHAHARGVIHADLKPHNIMITRSGEVRILGFGASGTFAGQISEDRTGRKRAPSAPRPAYASCELLEGRPADPRDDIYALACLSYELLAGAHPFQRRRSIEARDLGIVPDRPPHLTRRQWQALTMGLCWHRAGRSTSVRAWLKKLNADRLAVEQFPRADDLQPPAAVSRPAVPLRAAALLAALLIIVGFWVEVAHLAPIGTTGGGDLVPAVAASGRLGPGSVAPLDGAPLPATPHDAPPPAAQSQSTDANNAAPDDNRSGPPTGLTKHAVVSVDSYRVRSGEHFAEIRVHFSNRSGGDTPLVWWTESASAKPGIDYVPQRKARQSFSKGKNSTSFFVKLVPEASRAEPKVFYVAIAHPGRGSTLRQVARAAVWLPTTDDHSTAAAVAARGDTGTADVAGRHGKS